MGGVFSACVVTSRWRVLGVFPSSSRLPSSHCGGWQGACSSYGVVAGDGHGPRLLLPLPGSRSASTLASESLPGLRQPCRAVRGRAGGSDTCGRAGWASRTESRGCCSQPAARHSGRDVWGCRSAACPCRPAPRASPVLSPALHSQGSCDKTLASDSWVAASSSEELAKYMSLPLLVLAAECC